MITSLTERSLLERLQPRLAVEERFARTGRKYRNKSILFRYERYWIRPLLKLGLQVTGLYSRGVENALRPVVRPLTLTFPNLPHAFDGFQILHISDLHIDGVDGLAEVLRDILADLHPDLLVITGDYRFEDSGPCEEVYPRMETILSRASAKHGRFGILGNHDAAEIALTLEDMGLPMLVNEAVEIRRGGSSIWLAGVDDNFDYHCDDIKGSLANVPRDAFKVLLAHTPELYEEALEAGVDLYLCGHTHAGQIRFPKIGSIRHNAHCPQEYSYGHWTHGDLQGYTSAGTGCSGLPVRFNCPPELMLIELRRSE